MIERNRVWNWMYYSLVEVDDSVQVFLTGRRGNGQKGPHGCFSFMVFNHRRTSILLVLHTEQEAMFINIEKKAQIERYGKNKQIFYSEKIEKAGHFGEKEKGLK